MPKGFKKNILITGASSGIGRALAIKYAQSNVNLFLVGRDKDRLLAVKNTCQKIKYNNFQANVFCSIADVCNEQEMSDLINDIEQNYGLDLVIANAGISAGTLGGTESNTQIKKIFSTNVDGVLNTINPAIHFMKKRHKGQIAIISSLAGIRGLPSSPAYSASKAAVLTYGEALRGNLKEYGISVSVICPGYVKTPMTAVNKFPMPFIISDKKCAQIITDGLRKKKGFIAFPFIMYFILRLATLLPHCLMDKLFAKLPKKKGLN